MALPIINFTELFNALHAQYVVDFEQTFHISGSAIRCRNTDIPAFNQFIIRYTGYFRDNEVLLNHLTLVPAGQQDIETVNDNKTKILRLYGVAFHLYLKSCRHLNRQVNESYGDIVVIKLEAD